MNVDSVGPSQWTSTPQSRDSKQVVQDVFSEVLAAAGQDGYASAAAVSADQPLADQISTAWSRWFDDESRSGRYQHEADAGALKQSYGEILLRAYQGSGHAAPKAFLNNLSQGDLAVVQRVHRLADSIQVDDLTEEGAVNLLVPPPAQIDLNHDGFTRSGVAYGLRFPASTTPAAVVEAWDEATANMSFQDRMLYEFQMMLPLLTANIVTDQSGRFLHRFEPGDPGFTNPMARDDYSYTGAAQDRLNYLDAFRDRMPPEHYERDRSFWTRLLSLLAEKGAN